MSECSISFPGPVSRRTVCHLAIDFIKYVLYYRGQFPLPLDQLKNSLSDIPQSSSKLSVVTISNHEVYCDGSDRENNHLACVVPRPNVRARQIFVEAVSKFDNFFIMLFDILETQNILEIVLNIGPNMMNPKEMYHIKLPFQCCNPECANDFASFQKCKLQFFRTIMESSLWTDLKSDCILPISILLHLGPGVSLTEHMELKHFYAIPNSCRPRRVFFTCSCAHVNETIDTNNSSHSVSRTSNQNIAVESSQRSGLWVKMRPDLKGFKCYYEKNV